MLTVRELAAFYAGVGFGSQKPLNNEQLDELRSDQKIPPELYVEVLRDLSFDAMERTLAILRRE